MAKYLVTGGAGFIGSHLVERLVSDGQSVRVLDNFSSGKRSNLAPFGSKIEMFEGDLRRPDDCRRACEGVEVIFHQAAVPSVPKSVEDPVTSHQANVDGTFNLLVAARDARCRRVIYAASSSAYGDLPELPKRETVRPEPLSPYAANKLFGEYYCRVFTVCYGLETISLRYFNVFGPRQDPKSQYAAAIPAFVSAILRDEPPLIYGDGEQTRDFTYIDNVVHANMLAATAPPPKRRGDQHRLRHQRHRQPDHRSDQRPARQKRAATIHRRPPRRRQAFARRHRPRQGSDRLRAADHVRRGPPPRHRLVPA